VLPELAGPAWDGVKVGAGPPPILTEHGWLLIYHGVKGYGGHYVVFPTGLLLQGDELWYRYVPESGNWHGRILTRWMATVSAAPLSLVFALYCLMRHRPRIFTNLLPYRLPLQASQNDDQQSQAFRAIC